MGYTRKDQVYVLSNFFALTLVGFTCFMSSDFIRLLSFDTVEDEGYWIFLYQIVFWFVTVAAMLVRTPAAPCLMYCLRFNAFFTAVTAVCFFMKWFEPVSFCLVIIFWAYSAATAMVNAIVFASYHTSGARGLALGCMLSFCSTYVVLEVIKAALWRHGTVGSYRNAVLGYIAIRLALNFVSMATLAISAEALHFADFDRAFRFLNKGVLLEWISGTIHEIDVQLALSDVVPRYVSPITGIKKLKKKVRLLLVWMIFIVLSLSCSVFTPYLGAAHWDLSVFKIGEFDRAEQVGNFFGVILGAFWRRSWCSVVAICCIYVVHLGLSGLLTCYVHSYKVSLALSLEPVIAVTCFSAALGSFLTVMTFTHFFDLTMDVVCDNESKASSETELCCRDDDSSECLCSEQFCNESCGKCPVDAQGKSQQKVKIYVPENNKEMYKLLRDDVCLLCWLYRHNPREVCNLAADEQEEAESTDGDGQKEVCYLLRNCKVSICPYCDMNLLMECEHLTCTCVDKCRTPVPNATWCDDDEDCEGSDEEEEEASEEKGEQKKEEKKEDQGSDTASTATAKSEDDDETDDKPIKLPLHEMKFSSDSNISLVTVASTSFVVADSSCCECGSTKASKNKGQEKPKPTGRNFEVCRVCVYGCCHYGLKVMLQCKEPCSKFHLMQTPYPGKFSPVGAIVFNGTGSGSAAGSAPAAAPVVTPSGTEGTSGKSKKRVSESNESTKHASLTSTLQSLTRLSYVEDPRGDNGLCVCCKHAKELTDKMCQTGADAAKAGGSSPKSGETTPKCCHIKVQPTALPYHFRRKDIYRHNYVGALLFVILFFGLAKLIAAGFFALLDFRFGFDLSSNFNIVEPFFKLSEDPATYGVKQGLTDAQLYEVFCQEMVTSTLPGPSAPAPLQTWLESPAFNSVYEQNVNTFKGALDGHSADGVDDLGEKEDGSHHDDKEGEVLSGASSGSSTVADGNGDKEGVAAEGTDKAPVADEEEKGKNENADAEKSLLDYENERVNDAMDLYRWLFNDLEFAYLKNWAEVYIDAKKKEDDFEKVKRVRRISWCLTAGLKDYAVKSGKLIVGYLHKDDKWRAEWRHYEKRVKLLLKSLGTSPALISPLTAPNIAGSAWQSSVTQAKLALWRKANQDALAMAATSNKLEDLEMKVAEAEGEQELVALLALWSGRVEVLDEWNDSGTVFLGWRQFRDNWNQIQRWTELFLDTYLEEYSLRHEQEVASS